jgi:hypothetical protein
MADSTTPLFTLSSSQNNQEARINELFDAASPGTYFGRNADTSTGLTWGYFAAKVLINGTPTTVASGTKTLTASATNYISVSQAGVVSVGTSRLANECPLYSIVTGSATVTTYTDEREPKAMERFFAGRTSQAMADANQTITQAQSLCETLVTTGALTAARNLVVPLRRATWIVRNDCTGFGVQVIGASGTGTTIGVGKTAIVSCDGTNVVRVTADV